MSEGKRRPSGNVRIPAHHGCVAVLPAHVGDDKQRLYRYSEAVNDEAWCIWRRCAVRLRRHAGSVELLCSSVALTFSLSSLLQQSRQVCSVLWRSMWPITFSVRVSLCCCCWYADVEQSAVLSTTGHHSRSRTIPTRTEHISVWD